MLNKLNNIDPYILKNDAKISLSPEAKQNIIWLIQSFFEELKVTNGKINKIFRRKVKESQGKRKINYGIFALNQ